LAAARARSRWLAFCGGGVELAEAAGQQFAFRLGERAEKAAVVLPDGLAQLIQGRPPAPVMVTTYRRRSRGSRARAPVPAEITAVLGNESRKGPWIVPPHLAVRSVLGDCHLEMQEAVIGQQVTTIDATVRFGSVTIFVPDGTDVRMTGRAVLGAKSSQLRGEPRPGAPVIVVRCNVLCGSVTVRRPSWLMQRAS
jgi:hypothetical protein